MYAIISNKAVYTKNGITKGMLVASYCFTEMGWQAKLTKTASKAKQYKRYQSAYNAARDLGTSYQVITL